MSVLQGLPVALDSAWAGVIGALGGVVVTGVIGVVTAGLTHRWQEASRRAERMNRVRELRGELRRNAYARYLVAATSVEDHFLSQPPVGDAPTDMAAAMDRLRGLRATGGPVFGEWDAAVAHARLLGGPAVVEALDVFEEWLNREGADALFLRDPLQSGVFADVSTKRNELLEVMKTEQEQDLLGET